MRGLFNRLGKLMEGYYIFLLACLILLFIFRPFRNEVLYVGVWKFFFSGMILTSVYNVHHNHVLRLIATYLAGPTIILAWLDLAYPCPIFFISNAIATASFLFLCTYSILVDVILRAKVTIETLRGVICAYFMIAFAFGYTYYLIEYILPHSFHMIGIPDSIYDYSYYFSQFMYFSFVTLLTIGFGDVTPLRALSQTAVVVEGIVGQFYIAILVARIVAVYSVFSEGAPLTSRARGLKKVDAKAEKS